MRLRRSDMALSRAGSRRIPSLGRPALHNALAAVRLSVAASFAALLAACGAGDGRGSGAVVRDSMGIAIVENHAPVWAEADAWTVAAEPMVSIGVAEGDEAYQLYEVRNAVRLSDGRIVIANGGTRELRFYDPGGRHLKSVGGQGGGPGEFEFMLAVQRLPGDTLLVGDGSAGRISIFGPDGEFVRSHRTARPLGRLADGRLVRRATKRDASAPEEGVRQEIQYLVAYGVEDGPTDTLFQLPPLERYRMIARAGNVINVAMRPVPFARVPIVAVAGDLIFSGNGESYEVRVHGADGALRRLIRRMVPNPPVTQADIDAFRDRLLGGTRDENARRTNERYLAAVGFPETMPAFDAFQVDAAGNLWVRQHRTDDAASRWDAFDPDGRWLGTVELPAGLEVDEIGTDYVLGRTTDELDISRVQLHLLEKPAG